MVTYGFSDLPAADSEVAGRYLAIYRGSTLDCNDLMDATMIESLNALVAPWADVRTNFKFDSPQDGSVDYQCRTTPTDGIVAVSTKYPSRTMPGMSRS